LIAYYICESIHQIPSVIYIARVLGGIIVTNGPHTFEVLQKEYKDVPSEFYSSPEELRARLTELRPEAVVQPDFSIRFLRLKFDTVHVQVFHGTSDKTYNLWPVAREYDLLLLPGERAYKVMSEAGLLKENNYAVVGYPKMDRVFRGEFNRDDAVRNLGLDPNRPTVLYAPTWRDYQFNTSLPRYGAEVLSTVPPDYNLIVKLHPNTKLYDRKNYGMVERLAGQKPRTKLLGFEHDIIPVMAAADLLITDISTVSHEFLCFDRPMIFLDPRPLPLGRKKTWVWKAGRVVRKKRQIWSTVAEELRNPDNMAKERKEVLKEIFYKPDGHAAERAARAILSFVVERAGRQS